MSDKTETSRISWPEYAKFGASPVERYPSEPNLALSQRIRKLAALRD